MNRHDRNPVQEKHDEHEHNRYGENHDAGTWRTTDEGQADARQEDQLKSITEFFGGNLDRHIAFQAWIMRSHAAFTDGAQEFRTGRVCRLQRAAFEEFDCLLDQKVDRECITAYPEVSFGQTLRNRDAEIASR